MSLLKTPQLKLKYGLTVAGIAIYYTMLAVMLAIMLLRSHHGLWTGIPLFGRYALYSHASNFALSFLLVWTAGLMIVLNRVSWHYLAGLGVLMILANIVIESFTSVLNTPDMIDTGFGIAGVVLSLLMLLVLQKFTVVNITADPTPSKDKV